MEARRDIFQAIADPTRRELLGLLARETKSVNQLATHFSSTRQAISLHLKVLEECGVVQVMKQGRERKCTINVEKLAEVNRWMNDLMQVWEARFNQLEDLLGQLQDQS